MSRFRRWTTQPVHLLDHQKKNERNNEEFYDRIDEDTVANHRNPFVRRFFERRHMLAAHWDEQVGKIDMPQKQANDRHKDVVYQGGNDLAERGTDDNTNCQIDHVPFHGKLFGIVDSCF